MHRETTSKTTVDAEQYSRSEDVAFEIESENTCNVGDRESNPASGMGEFC